MDLMLMDSTYTIDWVNSQSFYLGRGFRVEKPTLDFRMPLLPEGNPRDNSV